MRVIGGLIVLGLLLTTEGAMAAARCTGNLTTRVAPLQAVNLTVGRDVPNGAEIYRQSFKLSGTSQVACFDVVEVKRIASLNSKPFPLSAWSGSPYGGSVYNTNVQGVGVVIVANTEPLATTSESKELENCKRVSSCVVQLTKSGLLDFDVIFLKIGEVAAGTIQGTSLPTVEAKFNERKVLDLSYSGSINIVSRTCTTPDVEVAMGSHRLSAFSGKATSTAWKDFSISLNNCPAFHGYYQTSGPTWMSNGTVSGLNVRKSNVLRVRLDSTITPIDADKGILSLNAAAAGAATSAKGIGVQIADSLGNPLKLATLHASKITPTSTEGASYTIALRARYIQTEDTVTAGPANATSTFTIDYY